MKLSDFDIEIDVDAIVVKELKDIAESFEQDLDTIKKTGEAVGYISWDPKEDKEALEEELKAINRVLKLYE